MIHLLPIVAASMLSTGAGGLPDTPETIVTAFIADYEDWNTRAKARSDDDDEDESDDLEAAMEQSEREYAALIAKYCRPGFKHQPISYGDESMHVPGAEEIVSIETQGDRALVRTRHTRRRPWGDFVSDFEYRLSKADPSQPDSRWYLESVVYVDHEGSYESL